MYTVQCTCTCTVLWTYDYIYVHATCIHSSIYSTHGNIPDYMVVIGMGTICCTVCTSTVHVTMYMLQCTMYMYVHVHMHILSCYYSMFMYVHVHELMTYIYHICNLLYTVVCTVHMRIFLLTCHYLDQLI